MATDKQAAPVNLTLVRSPNDEKEMGERYGNVLATLSQLFSNNNKGEPPAVLVVETKAGRGFYQAGRAMAQHLNLPVIFADADLAVDEIHGTPVGRIESTGDSLFRKVDETGAGIVVIDNADQIGAGSGLVLQRIFDGKALTVPGLDHPIDFSKWTVVLGSDENSPVSPDLKSRSSAVIHLDGYLFPPPG